jgi:WD40 repeat protein
MTIKRNALAIWETATFKKSSIDVGTDFAWAPLPDNAVVYPHQWFENSPRLEVYDIVKGRRRSSWDLAVRAPVVLSPDGRLLAAVSSRDPRHILIISMFSSYNSMTFSYNSVAGGLANVIPHHIDEVTHLVFMPDGTELVSLSKDGSVRVSSVQSGRTRRKFEVETRYRPEMLQVSPDGEMIASVLGREVMLWYPKTGAINGYRLDMVRQSEGWPLCISPNCRYLLCRTEEGFDVSDLATGKFRGEVAGESSFATSAAFSSDSRFVVIGKFDGEIQMYQVITGMPSQQ